MMLEPCFFSSSFRYFHFSGCCNLPLKSKSLEDTTSPQWIMSEGLYEPEVQRMVRNTVKKLVRKWKGIRKYHAQVSFINNETFACRVVNRLLQSVNVVTRKRNYFTRLESIGNICCCRIWLNKFSYRSISRNRSF